MELHHRARRGLEEQSERAASSAEASNRTNRCGMSKSRTTRGHRHYLVLLDSSVATQAFGVIPRVLRKSSTNALGCRYPTSAATVFTAHPSTSNSIPSTRRTCLRQNSLLVPTSLRKILWIVLTLAPTFLHSAPSDGASC